MRKNLIENLSASGKGVSENRISKALSTVFVSGQIALALMLTVGAGLLLYSLAKVLDGDFGYEPEAVSVVRVRAFGADYRDDDKRPALQAQLLSQLRSKPGIESAGLSGNYPTNSFPIRTFSIRGYEMQDGEAQVSARFKEVSDGYFETMELELLDGNYFTVSDQVTNRRSLIIDKSTAERYFQGESAVGKKLGFVGPDTPDEDWPVVVGVVEDSKQLGLDSTEEDVSFFYLNMAERPTGQFFVVVKSKRSPSDVTKIVEAIVHGVDPRVPVLSMGSLEEILGESLARRKVLMTLLAIIAVIAVSLATIGIYGVIAYSLFQKTREIGTRIALGASKLAILNYVLKDGLFKALLGMLLGVAGAVFISRLLAAQLYDVQPTDPSVYALVCLAVLLITMLAVYIPARRASNIAPMEALRTE